MATYPWYTCRGSVRGGCGHRHRTLEGAARCCAADQRGCARQGGYSDRRVRVVVGPGESRGLTESEYDSIAPR